MIAKSTESANCDIILHAHGRGFLSAHGAAARVHARLQTHSQQARADLYPDAARDVTRVVNAVTVMYARVGSGATAPANGTGIGASPGSSAQGSDGEREGRGAVPDGNGVDRGMRMSVGRGRENGRRRRTSQCARDEKPQSMSSSPPA